MKFSAQNLCRVLRDRSLWPEGFEWDYTGCDQCAMGLISAKWGISNNTLSISRALRISEAYAYQWFIKAHRVCGVRMWNVTPEHVASLIEEYCGIKPSTPVSFTAGAPDDSERWDNRRKVVEPAAALRAIEAHRGQQ